MGLSATEELPQESTILLDGNDVSIDEPLLYLVSLNKDTAATVEFPRSVLHDSKSGAAAVVQNGRGGRGGPLPGAQISCGRDPVNTIVLEDPRVSSQHFTIRAVPAEDGHFALNLEDQSRNGTWVNDIVVGHGRTVPLSVGDKVYVLPSTRVGKGSEIGYLLLGPALQASIASSPTPAWASRQLEISADIQCGICAEVIHRCLTLVPCGHNFCLVCILEWRHRSTDCPSCRGSMRQAVRNRSIDGISEAYLKANPSAAREPADIRKMDEAESAPSNAATLRRLLQQGTTPLRRCTESPRGWISPQREGASAPQRIAAAARPLAAASRGAAGGAPSPEPGSARVRSSACIVS